MHEFLGASGPRKTSTSEWAVVLLPSQTLSVPGNVPMTGATVQTPDEWWGAEGSGVPLDVTVNSSQILLAGTDAMYHVHFNLIFTNDIGDAGKSFRISMNCNDMYVASYATLMGNTPVVGSVVDRQYSDDNGTSITLGTFGVDLTELELQDGIVVITKL